MLSDNCKGRYRTETVKSVLFAPHCPNLLLENFLWTNWDLNLSNILVISNSFKETSKNAHSNHIKETISRNFLKETNLQLVINEYFEPFSDLSIHSFVVDDNIQLAAKLPEPQSLHFYSA